MATTQTTPQQQRTFLNYRTVWRWHFYAGVFAVPFILWLATTGSIYLFKPQIESLLDRPYDSLSLNGSTAPAAAQVKTALAAVPGSTLHYYELPRTTHSATRIIVAQTGDTCDLVHDTGSCTDVPVTQFVPIDITDPKGALTLGTSFVGNNVAVRCVGAAFAAGAVKRKNAASAGTNAIAFM